VLRSLSGPTWLVLGDMAELGDYSKDSHADIGVYARDSGVKRLFALGELSSRAVETFGSGGEWFADAESLTRRLQAEVGPGVTLLIKGSRVNRLERVVQALSGGGSQGKPMMRAS
jgi:UDP-N-acetylmuramoyl-tripeptide--D-alanyl-D-alanine ligase